MFMLRLAAAAAIVLVCSMPIGANERRPPRTNAVLHWNAIIVTTVGVLNPFAQARAAAMTHLAMFEAVNAISPRYEPYLGSIRAASTASPEAAVIAAAHGVLRALVPTAASALDAERLAALAAIRDGQSKVEGIGVGEAAAAAMLAARAADGSVPPEFHLPASAEPGEWQPTPSCPPAGGVLKHWGRVTPFGVRAVEKFHSAPPPPLTSRRYARDLNEVKEVGALTSTARTQHQTDVARFYSAVLAVATWNPVVRQVTAMQKSSLLSDARLFALLNMAISDGAVAVMHTKYQYNFWRPETAIHRADDDGNPWTSGDPSFQPLIAAPCFPSYGSAHAAASHAARRVAETYLGDEFPAVTLTNPAVPGIALEYEAFDEITDDIDMARIYGGIHFRFDQRAGARQGMRIGTRVYMDNLRKRDAD
jgi:hypothetical protein